MATADKHLTAPDHSETGWPKGVKYIIGNEGCERFSFYGMRSILQIHLTALFLSAGLKETLAEEHAQEMYHLFIAGVYAFPMIGAIIADRWLGKYRTILTLSLVYCLGHVVLSIGENSILGMQIGLGLIAVGSGGIKPCVSAHVGDQFGKGNWNLVPKVFQAFYFIINFGSFFATWQIPRIRQWEQNFDWGFDIGAYHFSPSIAFGLPGVLMLIATIVFWMGRKVFVHVPAKPGGKLGFLDALSSSLIFLGAIGLPLFFWEILPAVTVLLGAIGLRLFFWGTLTTVWFFFMAVFLVASGIALFNYRQKRLEDDGFLAVMLHSFSAALTGKNRQVRSNLGPEIEPTSVRRNWFFASAAQKYDELTAEGPRAVLRIISVFFLVSVFWALFDQHGSSWVRQAQKMALNVNIFGWWKTDLLPSQIGAMNPAMVMCLIPLNNLLIYPMIDKVFKLSPLKKMTIGMFMASVAFVLVAILQSWIENAAATGNKIHVLWQFFPYLVMTQAEVMVSITGLEFAYTQAPARMKSTIMGFWLLSVALGNKLVAIITKLPDMGLLKFFWVFAGLMAMAATIFGIRAIFYRYKDYTQ